MTYHTSICVQTYLQMLLCALCTRYKCFYF